MPCFAATFKVEAEEFEALVFIARFFKWRLEHTLSAELYAALLNHENRVEEN